MTQVNTRKRRVTPKALMEKELFIVNRFGLHGRAAAKLVEVASSFSSEIMLVRDDAEVDCKSILDVMSMACTQGTPVAVRARGSDAEAALAAVEELINNRFGEE